MLFNVEHPAANSRMVREKVSRRTALLTELADTYDLKQLARLSPDLALCEVAPLLYHVARDQATHALFDDPQGITDGTRDPFVLLQCRGDDGSYALQLFSWPSYAATAIHDHSCWGAFCPVIGVLLEDRYVRLDDGTQPNQAHIRTTWRRAWSRDDGVSTLLPYAGGIHRVYTPNNQRALSVHLYGPPEAIEGRDYDPARDYGCDRPPDE